MEQQVKTTSRAKKPRREWMIAAALVVLSFVPSIAGIARLTSLGNQAAINPDNARFLTSPVPITLHVVASLVFGLIGAFQFLPSFRQRNIQWHRTAGKWLMGAGLISALTGLWMTVFYTIPQPLQGSLLYIVRLLVGVGMALSIYLAWTTIRAKNVSAHKAWMMRAYALGQGAGTQVVIFLPYIALLGQPDQLTRDILMSLAWVMNLVYAEWLLRPHFPKSVAV